MPVQYLTDAQGRRMAAAIPIDEWESMQARHHDEDAGIDLRRRGMSDEVAQELRARLETFAQDWEDPSMDAYDRYDDAKSRL